MISEPYNIVTEPAPSTRPHTYEVPAHLLPGIAPIFSLSGALKAHYSGKYRILPSLTLYL
jgi:hypothetical protein